MCRSAAEGGRRCPGSSGGGQRDTAAAGPGAGRDLKAEQDARIRAATRERMEAEKDVTAAHAAIWAGRPSRGTS